MTKPPPMIEEWTASHPRWAELQCIIEEQRQAAWVNASSEWHQSSHLLVATRNDMIVGFLRYVIQEIGPDMDCPALTLHGTPLTEAKILAFGVGEPHRRQGIGRTLQEAALQRAKAQDCYQVRSHSSGYSQANHQLKLALGFAVHPLNDDGDDRAAYFVMPLGSQQSA